MTAETSLALLGSARQRWVVWWLGRSLIWPVGRVCLPQGCPARDWRGILKGGWTAWAG